MACFSEVFEVPLTLKAPAAQTVAVAVVDTRHGAPRVLCLKRRPERHGFWQCVTGRIEAGETPVHAAARELREETGHSLPVRDLGYRHSFALAERVPPWVIEESGFGALWPAHADVRLDPSEHEAFEWLPVEQALERMPFIGLRETVRRALL